MTKFLDPSFSTYAPADQSYRDNWDRIFGKKKEKPEAKEPELDTCDWFMSCGCGWYTDGGCICYTRR